MLGLAASYDPNAAPRTYELTARKLCRATTDVDARAMSSIGVSRGNVCIRESKRCIVVVAAAR